MQSRLEKIANHLEFLGYQIDRSKTDGGKDILGAAHSKHNNLVVVEYDETIIFFRVSLRTQKEYSKEIADYVNEMNQTLSVCRVFYETESESKKIVLGFNVMYIGDYTKDVFAAFLEALVNDTENIFQSGESFNKIFLEQ